MDPQNKHLTLAICSSLFVCTDTFHAVSFNPLLIAAQTSVLLLPQSITVRFRLKGSQVSHDKRGIHICSCCCLFIKLSWYQPQRPDLVYTLFQYMTKLFKSTLRWAGWGQLWPLGGDMSRIFPLCLSRSYWEPQRNLLAHAPKLVSTKLTFLVLHWVSSMDWSFHWPLTSTALKKPLQDAAWGMLR